MKIKPKLIQYSTGRLRAIGLTHHLKKHKMN